MGRKKDFETVICRTPVRATLTSGGIDFDAYFLQYGGFEVCFSINKYVYVIAHHDGHKTRICTSHPAEQKLPKATLFRLGTKKPVNLMVSTTLAAGTGLGTGGAITVGLVYALSMFNGEVWDKNKIADTAYRIERHDLGLSCGKKDQFSTAFGGINAYFYNKDDTVDVKPVRLSAANRQTLQNYLMLFDSGQVHDSEKILKTQVKLSAEKIAQTMHILKDYNFKLYDLLKKGNLRAIGPLMRKTFEIKKKIVPNFSTPHLDRGFNEAFRLGASGGRISGAGGGGFILLFAHPAKQGKIRGRLEQLGYEYLPFLFDFTGTQIINTS